MRRTGLALIATTLIGWAGTAGAGIISALEYANDAAFSAATGATSLTGPLPNVGNQGTSTTLGDATLSAGNTIFVGAGWSSLIPGGNAIAISGPENLDVALDTGLASAFGFYFHEPGSSTAQLDGCNTTCAVSAFEIDFYRGGMLLGTQAFDPADDQLIFFGIILDEAFDEVRFRETVGTHDNEFYGEMYVKRVPEPAALLLTGLGLLALGATRRLRR